MRLLLWLYPRSWRRQYGLEMQALLGQMRGRRRRRPRMAADLVRGAVDAHLHPQRPRRRRPRWLAAGIGVLAAALGSQALATGLGAAGAAVRGAVLAGLWLAVAVAWRWLGSRTLFLFSLLAAARFAADWSLRSLALPITHGAGAPPSHWIAAGLAEVLLWGGVVALVLRGTRLAWPAAFAAGCLLELVLGSTGIMPTTLLPGYLDPVRIAVWAAIVTALAGRRRPRPWADPPEGAPVSARPAPDSPEPMLARGRRAS